MGQGLTFLGCGHPIVNKMDKKIHALTTIYSRRKRTHDMIKIYNTLDRRTKGK